MKKVIVILLFFITAKTISQNELGSWNIINISLKMNQKTTVFTEAQLRSLSFYNEFHYYEYKAGVSYKINPNFSLTSGIGSYNTFSEGGNFKLPSQNREVRTWFQINMKNPLEFLTFEHRYRAEQRFTANGYRNRFRYRIGATIPLNGKKIAPKIFYLSTWNEIFFTDKEPFFERNRILIGGGYEFNKNVGIQMGYIYQFDYKINDESGRDFINIALLYQFDLSKKEEKEFTPTSSD